MADRRGWSTRDNARLPERTRRLLETCVPAHQPWTFGFHCLRRQVSHKRTRCVNSLPYVDAICPDTGPAHSSRRDQWALMRNGAACLGERITTTPEAQRTRTASLSQASGSGWVA